MTIKLGITFPGFFIHQTQEVRMRFYGQDVSDMSIRQINRLFRQHDESHLWPICNHFNATDRAIRRLRRNVLPHMGQTGGIEYAAMLDAEISRIVNSAS